MTVLVDRLGAERAAIVIEAAGGQRLAVPETLEEGNAPRALEKLLGRELAICLVIHFGGGLVYVPRCAGNARAKAAKLSTVVRMTRAGESANAIARKCQCSDRTVYARRAEARELGLLPARV